MTLDYYISSRGRTATVSLYDPQKQRLRKVSGSELGDEPLTLHSSIQGYPAYEVITIDGVIDVVEHRAMEPIFYMTDDPAVLEELRVPANQRLERP